MSPKMVGHSISPKLMEALGRAIALINLYAQQLNASDGGNRKIYQSVEEWLEDGTSN